MSTDYYEILGIGRTTSTGEIKRAYRRLARRYHPDVNNGDPPAEQKFKAISEAYAVLSDPRKRREYDLRGHRGIDWFFDGGLDIFEIFRQAFGDTPFGQGTTQRQGRSIQAQVSIDLAEVLSGTTRTIQYSHLATCTHCEGNGIEPGSSVRRCPTCQGTGQVRQTRQSFLGVMTTIGVCPDCRGQREVVDHVCQQCRGQGAVEVDEELEVTIPAGIGNGQEMLIRGAGDVLPGSYSGDLYVVVHIEPHELFERHDSDLHTHLSIGFAEAALGTQVAIPTLEGEANLEIPPGTQPRAQPRLPGHGLVDMQSGRRGDLVVRIQVTVPQRLTKRQRELLEELAAEDNSRGPEPS